MSGNKKIFVTGTGTDVGKTYISALLVKKFLESGINTAYFKAGMSGNVRDSENNLIPGDAVYVKKISGTKQPLESMCPYVYEKAYSPHLAARLEGSPIDINLVLKKFDELNANYNKIVMEGSGGILCPLRLDEGCSLWLEDVIKARDFDCIIVADAGLGTINAVGLTASYMKAHDMNLTGIIFNHFQPGNIMHEDNLKVCEELTGVKVIACVSDNQEDINIK